MRLFVALLFIPMLASGGLCGKSEPEVEEESPAEVSAAERLQKGRNVYDGHVNQNLRELRQDLEAAGQERVDGQEEAIDRALNTP